MSESEDDLIVMFEEAMEDSEDELDLEETKLPKPLKEQILSKRFLYNISGILLSILLMIIIIRTSFGSFQIFKIGQDNPWQYQLFLAFFFSGIVIGLFSFSRKDSLIIGLGLMGVTFVITVPMLIKLLTENDYLLVDTLYFTFIFLFLALLLIGAYIAYEVKDYIKWLIEKRKITNSM
ncbi:MAG: hypothetical protein KGD59_09710 [Candidatus Heimdallarchaeota archaeon]|nr:hypothetical protein [Candidatus Heimdallarchaeota archaeon]MBY8994811.1 hypothetical protein [Candidatus Heimdallarchaeota archaeon]